MDKNQILNIYVLISLTTSFSSLFLLIYSLFLKKNKVSFYFQILMVTFTLYCFGYANEIMGKTLNDFMFWIKIEYLGMPLISPFWVLVAAEVTGYKRWINKRTLMLMFFIPVLIILLVMTNEYHYLYYTSTKLVEIDGLLHIKIGKGFFYILYESYYNFLFLIGDLMLLKMYFKSHSYYKKQALVLLVASIVPWIGDMLYSIGFRPYGFELTPVFLMVMGPVLLAGITKYKMMDLTPTALELVFMTMDEAVFVFDDNNRLVNFNFSGKKIIKNLDYDQIGKGLTEIFYDYPDIISLVKNDKLDNHTITIKNEYSTKYFKYSINDIYEKKENKVGKTLLLTDITNQIELMEKLKESATIDELTKLNNRRFFRELSDKKLETAIENKHSISAIMMDIDYFKKINDTYGHETGDKVLKKTGEILSKFQNDNSVIGRYGGEEFVMIISNSKFENVLSISENIKSEFEQAEIAVENCSLKVTMSIGLCYVTSIQDESLDELIKISDIELYKAKESGRNCIKYSIKN